MLPLLSLHFSFKRIETLIAQTILRDKILITPSFQDRSGSHTNLDMDATEELGCTWNLYVRGVPGNKTDPTPGLMELVDYIMFLKGELLLS